MGKRKWTREKAGADTDLRRRNKKILLCVAGVVLALLLLAFGGTALIRHLTKPKPPQRKEYRFYPIVEGEDIFADAGYVTLDRNPYFENPNDGITVSFSADNLSAIPEDLRLPVDLLLRYVDYAIHGQTEQLNALCSEKYLKSGFELKEEFTPQKIYDIKFTYNLRDVLEEEDGTWDRWRFWVEYKIRKNNGTFRSDMESDCSRRELFEITYRDGKVEIDAIAPYRLG